MVRTHPQWEHVLRQVHAGEIGKLQLISCHFSYNRRDPNDIRSRVEYGGGALLDIGCYPIALSRWIFQREPERVIALIDRDPQFRVDRLTSALMQFGARQATFSSAGQLVPYQRVHLFGTLARLEVEIPFNAPPDKPVRIFRDEGRDLAGVQRTPIEFPAVDQYAVQCDRFSAAVRGLGTVPVTVADGIKNMAVIDALFRSAESGGWEAPEHFA
jgi:predicted dehydrogenase